MRAEAKGKFARICEVQMNGVFVSYKVPAMIPVTLGFPNTGNGTLFATLIEREKDKIRCKANENEN